MSEFDEKLNALLSDPDSMARIMQLAQSLSGGESPPEASPPPPPQNPPTAPPPPQPDAAASLLGGIDPAMLMRFLPLVQELNRPPNSSAAQLLHALQPYLKPERQAKMDRALQLSRILCIGKRFLISGEGRRLV